MTASEDPGSFGPVKEPMTSPGRRNGGKMCGGMPAFRITSVAQLRARTSNSDVVEALVTSAPATPVSQ